MPAHQTSGTIEAGTVTEEVNVIHRIIIGTIALTLVIFVVSTHQRGTPALSGNPTPRPQATRVYSDDTLRQASAMTQQMSVPGALNGHEYHNHGTDEQLRLSSDPEFARELESYQYEIDRMLARTP